MASNKLGTLLSSQTTTHPTTTPPNHQYYHQAVKNQRLTTLNHPEPGKLISHHTPTRTTQLHHTHHAAPTQPTNKQTRKANPQTVTPTPHQQPCTRHPTPHT